MFSLGDLSDGNFSSYDTKIFAVSDERMPIQARVSNA